MFTELFRSSSLVSSFSYLEGYLFSCRDTQHGSAVGVYMRALVVSLAFLAHMRSRPINLSVFVVFLVQITFSSSVVSGVNSLAIRRARVCTTAVCEIGTENQKLACMDY